MQTRCPFAEWRPLGTQTEPPMRAYEVVCIHTAVSPTLGSLYDYFDNEGYSGVGSHFGVGRDGRIWQFQSLDRQADANLNGNDRVWSIENADGYGTLWGAGDPVPDFTPEQLDANVRLVDWLCSNGGIPRRLIDSTCGEAGIGYHRQGAKHYMANPACERWTTHGWKTCPGDAKIHTIKTELIPRVRGEEDELSWDTELALWDPGDSSSSSDTMSAGQQLNQARAYAELAYEEAKAARREAVEDRTTRWEWRNSRLKAIADTLGKLSADGAEVDEVALARALAASLPGELAASVVDELAARGLTVNIG